MRPPRKSTLLACLIAATVTATPAAEAAIGTPVDLGSIDLNNATAGAYDITTSASTPAGASIIVTSLVTGSPAPGTVTCSDSAGNTYTSDVSRAVNTAITAICSTHQIAAELPSGSTVSVSAGGVSQAIRVRAFAVTGLAAAALDRTASGEGTGNTPSSGVAAPTTQPDEVLVGAIGNLDDSAAAAGFSPGTNAVAPTNNCTATGTPTYTAFAGVGSAGHSLFTIHCTVNATGAYAAMGTFGSVGPSWQAVLATYRAAETVSPPSPTPSGGSPQPTASPDCNKLRAKLKRQKRNLKKAGSEAKRSLIERNLEGTRERLRQRGC